MKRPPSRERVAKMREREAAVGLDPEDEAAQWLAEHDPPPPDESKSARKSKLLHQFRNRRDTP